MSKSRDKAARIYAAWQLIRLSWLWLFSPQRAAIEMRKFLIQFWS